MKVGDRVEVCNELSQFNGKIGILKVKGAICQVKFEDWNSLFHFNEWELQATTPKPFTKADLKTGMLITDREGRKAIIFEDRVCYKNSQPEELKDYRDDLTFNLEEFENDCDYDSLKDLDIMQVTFNGEVVFKREEKPNEHNLKELERGIKTELILFLERKDFKFLHNINKEIEKFIELFEVK